MREIKFRGKSLEDGSWVYGDLVGRTGHMMFSKYYIVTSDEGELTVTEVNRDTVGQYTGLKDKNMKEVWEGDIGTYYFGLKKRIGYVRYHAGRWIVDNRSPLSKEMYIGNDLSDIFDGIFWDKKGHPFEVIGNIHKNSELIK